MTVTDGRHWSFAVRSEGGGPAVVLLHGLLTDSRVWEPLVAELAGDFKVITVDAPGHGDSPPQKDEFTLEEEAEALADSVQGLLGGRTAVWIGHSMGGMKAMRIALRRPDAVSALVLISTQPYPEPERTARPYLAMVETVGTFGMSRDLAEVIGRMNFGRDCLGKEFGRRWVDHFTTLTSEQITAPCHAVYRRGDISPELGRIAVPTLVLHGVDDVPIRVDVARRYAALLPGARLVELPGTHHTPPCESPDEVSRTIRRFLAELRHRLQAR